MFESYGLAFYEPVPGMHADVRPSLLIL